MAWSGVADILERRQSVAAAVRSAGAARGPQAVSAARGRHGARRGSRRLAVPRRSDADRRGCSPVAARRRCRHQGRRQRALVPGRRAGRAGQGRLCQRAGKLRTRPRRACSSCSTISKPACRSCSSSRWWRNRRRRLRRRKAGACACCWRSPGDGRATNEAPRTLLSGLPPRCSIGIEARGANPPGALDLPPSNVIPAPVDMSPRRPPRVERSDPSGNPLWAIPLSALTATRERPLFLPSRRAPAPAVAGTPVVVAPPPPPPRRAGAAAAHPGRRDRERDRRLRGVPRSGDQQCGPAQDRTGSPGLGVAFGQGPRGDAARKTS